MNWESERRMAKDVEENPELYAALADKPVTQQVTREFDFARWDEMVYRECKECKERKSMPKHRDTCLDCWLDEPEGDETT